MKTGVIQYIDTSKRCGTVGTQLSGSLIFLESDVFPGVVFSELQGKKVEYQERISGGRPKRFQHHAKIIKLI